jgi:PAP2 (acid phosphatase) superfamily protein
MKQYKAFFIPYFMFVLVLSVLIACNTKADLHLWLTSFNSLAADVFFHYYTYVGDWLPYSIAGMLLLYKYRVSLYIFVAQIVTGLVSVMVKNMWNEPRPSLYFSSNFPAIQLHQVHGEHLHSAFSFPSGHTITAFAFFLTLSYFTKKPALHFLYFVLAVLVGYSRIYLSQHFAVDVLAGSLIGVWLTALCKFYLDKKDLKWADGSLLDVFLRK